MTKDWRDGSEQADGEFEPTPTSLSPGKRSRTANAKPGAPPQWPGKRSLTQHMAVQRKATHEESSPDPIETAARGTSGAGGTLPHLERIQASFGRHDVSQVRAHQDAGAVQATEALGASAFAYGDSVAFGAQPDLHTAAHEAAHVVQQRGGVQLKGGIDQPGDPYEQHADRVADAVVAGKSAESLLDQHAGGGGGPAVQRDGATKPHTTTTPDFVNQWGTKIIIAIMDRIEKFPPANPHPRLTWVSRQRAAEELGLAISHYIDAVPDQKLKRMMMLSYPADLFALIDNARRGPEGTRFQAVQIAVAAAFDEPLMASIARMGARTVVQLDQAHAERPRGADIVRSCPLDGVIADLLVRTDILTHTPKKKGGADDTPGKPFAKGAHDVKFEWLGSKDRNLWNWIKVTSPANATVEDVAQTSLRWDHEPDPEQAYRIAANPPYFGIPFELAKEIPLARDFAPDDLQVKLDTGPGPRVADPSALGKSAVSDEAALAQAPARSKGNLPIDQAIERTHTQLQYLLEQLTPWHLAKQLDGAIAFVERRRHELGADKKTAERYATALSLQERILHDAASELLQVLEEIQKAGAKPETVDTVPPVKLLLKAFARAAGVSHLHAEAPAALAEARSQRTMLPLSLAEDRIRQASRSIGDQREAEGGTPTQPNADKTPASLTDQLQRAADLRRAAATGEQIDPDAVETLNVDASESELRARLITLATYADALKKRANDVGLPSGDPWDVADVCELMLTKINKSVATQPRIRNDDTGGGWHEQLDNAAKSYGPPAQKNKVRRDAVKRVSGQLARFSEVLDVNGFFKESQEKIKDKELWNLIASIALQVGLTLVTGQILGAAGAAIRGLALAGEIGAEIRNASLLYHGTMIIAEAAVNTGIQGAMGGKMGVRELAENALATVLTTAAMKPFHSLLGEGAEVEKAIRTWGQVTKRGARLAAELVVETGAGIGAAGVAHAVTHGGQMTKHDAEEWVTQGLSIAASKFVQGRMIAMNHRITELAIHYKSAKLDALNVEVKALRDRATTKSDPHADTRPEEAIEILKDRRELLVREHAIYEHDPQLQKEKAASEKDLAATGADFIEMPLQLAHLSPLVDGHVYEGSPSEIQNAFSTADKTGVPMQREWIVERNVWRVTSGEHVIEIHERGGGKRPHEAEVGAHAVPDSDFTGVRPKDEKKPAFGAAEVAASTRDAAAIMNYGGSGSHQVFEVGDNRIVITVQGVPGVTVEVRVGEPMTQVAKHNYREGANRATITVSKEARPQDITRAVAHEIGEIQHAMERPKSLEANDALVKGSKEQDHLSAHDAGRRAELKILLYELQNQPGRKAEIQREIQKLIEHLGFDMATVNGDARARKIFGDAAIATVDTMVGRNRTYVKTEQITNSKPKPFDRNSKEWILPFEVTLADGTRLYLGQASCQLEHGRPTQDPSLAIFKTNQLDGKNVRISFGDPANPASLTDLALKTTIAEFHKSFGHDPDTLPGSLADDNKSIFQRAYATEITKGTDPRKAEQIAIMETPFGKKRVENGYTKLEVTPGKTEIEILIGHPPQLVKVPASIGVIARK